MSRSEFIRDWLALLSRLKPLLQADSPSDVGAEFIRDWLALLSRLKPLLRVVSPSIAGANSFAIGSDVHRG
jgi:hypothetical protein